METPTDLPNPPLSPEPAHIKIKNPSRFSTWRAMETVLGVSILVATLFTLWTPANLFSANLGQKSELALLPNQTQVSLQASPTPPANPVICIVAGHWGNDSGAVCPDGLTEADVNLRIATLVNKVW